MNNKTETLQPIGCRTLCFPKKEGEDWICMYCNSYTHPRIKKIKMRNGVAILYTPLNYQLHGNLIKLI